MALGAPYFYVPFLAGHDASMIHPYIESLRQQVIHEGIDARTIRGCVADEDERLIVGHGPVYTVEEFAAACAVAASAGSDANASI